MLVGGSSDVKKRDLVLHFQVAAVRKPLIAVKRIVDQGNLVSFGPKDEDNYIVNKVTGDKMLLRANGKGSYMMDVRFSEGGDVQKITVDSGAEESGCPMEWGKEFGMGVPKKWMNLKDASGRIK
jgi:hypothetical protein